MEAMKIRGSNISETATTKEKYDNAVRMLYETAKKFDSSGFKVTFDPNQLTMEFTDLTEKQEGALLNLVKKINANGGLKLSLVPGNDMYLLHFMRGNDGYAYVSNPIRQRETPDQAGTPHFNITDAYELGHGLEISAKKLLVLLRN